MKAGKVTVSFWLGLVSTLGVTEYKIYIIVTSILLIPCYVTLSLTVTLHQTDNSQNRIKISASACNFKTRSSHMAQWPGSPSSMRSMSAQALFTLASSPAVRGKVCQQPEDGGGFLLMLPGFLPPKCWSTSYKWNSPGCGVRQQSNTWINK